MPAKPPRRSLDAITPRTKPEPLLIGSGQSAPQPPPPAASPPTPPEPEATPPQSKKRHRSKKRLAIIIACAVVVVASGGVLAYRELHHPARTEAIATPEPPTPTPTPSPSPTTAPAPLTGLPVSPADAKLPVVAVMIENLYPYARPQSGLAEAGIVYEALAEGGITRFMALFQEPLPPTMGPVRSLRPYFLDWGLEHNIPVAHAGGSQPALAEIGPLGMKNINALEYDGSYFYRITTRFAPHNLYTNASLLTKLISLLGFAQAPTFTPLPRKDDAPAASPAATDIKIPFSYAAYNVEYTYNAAANDYLRFEGGAPQTDTVTGKQIQVKNVVVEYVPVTYATQNDGDPETNYQLIGKGQIQVFEDGNVIPGTWSKSSNQAPTQFDDTTGAPIKFNRGNTWISVVPTGTDVTY